MANQEDYLDGLLNSVMDEDSLEDAFDSELFETQEGLGNEEEPNYSDDEIDDFLKEFEAHLDEEGGFTEEDLDLDDEEAFLIEENDRESKPAAPESEDDLLGNLADVLNMDDEPEVSLDDLEAAAKEDTPTSAGAGATDWADPVMAKEPAQNEAAPVEEEPPQSPAPKAMEMAEPEAKEPTEQPAEEPTGESVATSEAVEKEATMAEPPVLDEPISEDHAELGEILQEVAGDDISEISDILNADDADIPVISEEGMDAAAIDKGKAQKDPNAPRGVKGKVLSALFEDLEIPTGEPPSKEEIEALEAQKAAEKAAAKEEKKRLKEEKKAQKAAEKEEKKKLAEEKKAQKAAEKAAKKAAKPKKEKKPKQDRQPIKKKPIIATLLFAAALNILVFLLASSGNYTTQMTEAQAYFTAGSYTEAFDSMAGLDIREVDDDFYQQAKLLGGLQKSYNDYLMRISDGDQEGAIDALIRGVGRYNVNAELAGSLGVLDRYGGIEEQIEQALAGYGIDPARAIELYEMEDRTQYTLAIRAYVSTETES